MNNPSNNMYFMSYNLLSITKLILFHFEIEEMAGNGLAKLRFNAV